MFSAIVKAWKYLGAALSGKLDERADPKIQLEQAVAAREEQGRRIRQAAAAVIGRKYQLELQIGRKRTEVEEATASARQSVILADEARAKGDEEKAKQFESAGDTIGVTLMTLESQLAALEADLATAGVDAGEAQAHAQNNQRELEELFAQRAQILSTIERANMQERVNATKSEMNSIVSDTLPTLDAVRDRVEGRLARAKGENDINAASGTSRVAEIKQATMVSAGQSRMEQIRASMRSEGATEAPGASSSVKKVSEEA